MSKKTIITGALIFVGGAGIGYGVGHILQKNKYEALIEKEIQQVKETYSDPKRKTGVFASPIDAADALIKDQDDIVVPDNPAFLPDNSTLVAGRSRVSDILREEQYLIDAEAYDGINRTGNPEEEEAEEIPVVAEDLNIAYNLIERAAEKSPEETIIVADKPIEEYASDVVAALEAETTSTIWDPETMAKNESDAAAAMPDPDPDNPYVITYAEFFNDEIHKDSKVSVIYFEEDDQVADEEGQLVNSVDQLIGRDNLEHFGLGSNDRNVVYIRNQKMGIDIEVVKDKRSFQQTILGVRPEKVRQPLRMRDNDL